MQEATFKVGDKVRAVADSEPWLNESDDSVKEKTGVYFRAGDVGTVSELDDEGVWVTWDLERAWGDSNWFAQFSNLEHFDPGTMSLPSLATAAPFDLAAHLERQIAWSERTFGPGPRTASILDHIRSELVEVESEPDDVSEWVDVAILALDGAWRAGHTPQQIIDALVAKQEKNEGRTWPDWRTADPTKAIEHDRSGDSLPAEVAGV